MSTPAYRQTHFTGTTVTARPWRNGTELAPARGIVTGPCPYGTDEYTQVWFPDMGAPDLGTSVHPIRTEKVTATAPEKDPQWSSLDYRARVGQLVRAATENAEPHRWVIAPLLARMLINGTHPEFPTRRTVTCGANMVTVQLDAVMMTTPLLMDREAITRTCYHLDPFSLPLHEEHTGRRCCGRDIHGAIARGWAAMGQGQADMVVTRHRPGHPPAIVARFIATRPDYAAA